MQQFASPVALFSGASWTTALLQCIVFVESSSWRTLGPYSTRPVVVHVFCFYIDTLPVLSVPYLAAQRTVQPAKRHEVVCPNLRLRRPPVFAPARLKGACRVWPCIAHLPPRCVESRPRALARRGRVPARWCLRRLVRAVELASGVGAAWGAVGRCAHSLEGTARGAKPRLSGAEGGRGAGIGAQGVLELVATRCWGGHASTAFCVLVLI